MGSGHHRKRLQTGIHRNSSIFGYKTYKNFGKNMHLVQKEINCLQGKSAVEKVSAREMHSGFYSTLFLVPKKNGEMRPVINLKPVNRYFVKKHFKMDTLSKVLNLVTKGDWALTIDLKDAYFHLKIFKGHRKYL